MYHSSQVKGLLSACALVASAGLVADVQAGVIGHHWIEVDNSTSSATGGPTHLDTGALGAVYRTFDLYVEVGQGVLVLDSAFTQSAGPNAGITIDNTSFFQFQPGGTDNNLPPIPGFFPLFPLLEFDSYVGMGDLSASQIGLTGFTFNENELTGTWFSSQGAPAAPTEDGALFVGRFTVESTSGFGTDESASRFLGGQLFVALADGDTIEVLPISNAFATIPTPGTAALMGLAAFAAWRKRSR